jgi:hypothetical protein
MNWFSNIELFTPQFNSDTSMQPQQIQSVKKIKKELLYPLRKSHLRTKENNGRPDWYVGGPYSLSPLPQLPLPQKNKPIPLPVYNDNKQLYTPWK